MKFIVASISFLWPGFSGIIRYGLWSQLAIALLFGALCQGVLVLTFLWCDFLSPFIKNMLYAGLFFSWVALNIVASVRLKKYEKMRRSDREGEAFLEAQTHYLKGNWFETECCLKAILKKNPYDSEALLFMATLYRHVKRFSDAKRMLAMLEKLDSSYRWQYEIALEKKYLKEESKEEKHAFDLTQEEEHDESETASIILEDERLKITKESSARSTEDSIPHESAVKSSHGDEEKDVSKKLNAA